MEKERSLLNKLIPIIIILMVALIFFVLAVSKAEASWSPQTGTCTNQSKTAGTSLTCTVGTANMTANSVTFMFWGGDNTASSDGNNGLLTSVTDSQSNTWVVDRCFTNAQTGAATGATTCIAHSKLTTTLVSGLDTITANFSSITAKGFVTKNYTITNGNIVQLVGTPQDVANDGADPGSLSTSGLASVEHLHVRAVALERATGGTWTASTNFTSATCNGTTGGGAASNMDACGEYRINTSTGETSDPTGTAVDCASTFMAFIETAPPTYDANRQRNVTF